MKSLKIKTKIICLVIFSVIVSMLAIYLYSHNTLVSILKEDIKNYKEQAMNEQKEKIKDLVDVAYQSVQNFYKDSKNEKEIENQVKSQIVTAVDVTYNAILSLYKKSLEIVPDKDVAKLRTLTQVRNLLSNLRYGKNKSGYFWINDLNGVMVVHPVNPKLEGKNLYNLKDKKGNPFFKEMIEVCKKHGKGFVKYWWTRPGSNKPEPKLSYVRLMKETGWIIGTGAYLDNTVQAFKKKAIETIKNMRYGKSGYFWINDLNGVIIVHPIKPQLNGKNLYNLKDKKGNQIFKMMIDVCKKKGKGFVKYWWTKPGSSVPEPKLSYVKLFKPWGWIIGSGIYIDNIKKEIKTKEALYHKKLKALTAKSLIILVILIIIFAAIGIFLTNIFIKPLEMIKDFVTDLSQGEGDLNKKINYEHNDEIGILARAFHKFIDKLQEMILNIGLYSGKADVATDKIMLSSVHLSKISDTQKASIEETSSGILEMSRSIKEVQENVDNTYQFVDSLENAIQEIKKETEELINNSGELINNVQEGKDLMVTMGNAMEDVQNGSEMILDYNRSVNEAGELVKGKIAETTTAIDKIRQLIDEVSTAINEQTASIEEVANNSNDTLNVTQEAQEKANNGKAALDKVLASMKSIKTIVGELGSMISKLEESAGNISEITNMINEISDQTNLLALNAAIEAARAGEAGKGFAVVADEVRKLAERSSKASSDIAELITGIQKEVQDATTKMQQGLTKVDEGVELTNEANTTMDEIVQATDNALRFVAQINNATEEQANVSRGIISSVQAVIEETENVENVQNALIEAGENIIDKSQELGSAIEKIQNLIIEQNNLKQQMDSKMITMSDSASNTQNILSSYHTKIGEIIDAIPKVLDGMRSVKIALDEQTVVADKIAGLAEKSVDLTNQVNENVENVYKLVVVTNDELATLNNEFGKFKFKEISFLTFAATQHSKNVISIFVDVALGKDVSANKKDHRECFCGQWLYGKGAEILGDDPRYQDLLNLHKKVHDKLNEFIETKDISMQDEILQLSDELSEKFLQLYKELSKEDAIVEVKK